MITTLVGENEVERAAELRRRVANFENEYGDMAVERVDGETASYERMCDAVQSLPFLVSRKLVVLRAPSANNEFTEKFESFLTGIADTNDVIIIEPKIDKRLVYYKRLKKLTDFREFPVLDANGLVRYAARYAKEQGGTLTTNDVNLLVDRVGIDQTLLKNEIDKLIAYSKNVTKENIELLTEKTPQSSIFDMLDAAFSGNTKRALELYAEQRALKVEPQQIIAMLAWQLHVLALILTAKGRSAEDIAHEAKLNPYVVRKSQALKRHISYAKLKQLVTELRELDRRTKSDGTIPDEAIQYYLLWLSQQ